MLTARILVSNASTAGFTVRYDVSSLITGNTPLFLLCKYGGHGATTLASFLREQGADLYRTNTDGWTLLMLLSQLG